MGMRAKARRARVKGVDLGHAVQRLASEGLLIKGGGHKMAAGLTVARDQLEPAMTRPGRIAGESRGRADRSTRQTH